MPKFKAPAISGAAEAGMADGGAGYSGEKPPVGTYTFDIKFMDLKLNKNDDLMLRVCMEIAEKGAKAKYNGYTVWSQFNRTEAAAIYLNKFLHSIGVTKFIDFWGDEDKGIDPDILVDDSTPPKVLRIGKKRLENLQVVAATKDDTYQGTTRLQAVAYSALGAGEAEEAGEVDAGDEPEPEPEDVTPEPEEGETEPEAEGDESLWTAADIEEMPKGDQVKMAKEWGMPRVGPRTKTEDIVAYILEQQDLLTEEDVPADGEPPF